MSATTVTTDPSIANATTTDEHRTWPLWKAGLAAGVVAALAATAVAGIALAADVPVEIDGEQIPLAGFAQLVLAFTAIGALLAKALSRWAARPRRTFVVTTVVLTALSFVPDLLVDATTATRLTLMATHLVTAAIVIPTLAGRLADSTR